MSRILKPLAVAAVIVGAAVLTGGISLAPSLSIGGAFGASTVAFGSVLTTTALGGALLSTAIGVALTGLSQAFTRTPRAGLSDLARLNLTQLAAAPRKMVLGDTAFAADLRYNEPSGSEQRYVDAIIHLASHRVTRIREMRIGDKLAWTDTGGVQGEFAGFLTVELRPEAGPSAFHTVNGGARWGANTRLTGCATARIRIDRQGTKRTQSPFAGGLPQQVMFIGEGMPVYDPRRDSTVPGGSGAHRVNDQTTWQYRDGSTVLGSNLALMALAWRLGWRINGVVSCGLGNPVSRLDLAAFAAAANVCDELVTLAGGGTQRRYHGGGLISDDADKQAIEQAFADCVGGWWDDGRGALGLFVSVNDLAGAVVSLNDDDIQSPVKWDPFPDLAETWNVVRGLNPEPALPANFQPTEYPEVRIPSLDGIDRVLQLNLAFIQDKRTPQRLAKQALQRAQYPALFSATFGTRGWLAKKGRVVELTCAKLGFAAELFRVVDRQKNVDGTVNLVLRKENPAIYQWAAEESPPVVPATPITYNPLNQPFVVATVAALNALDEIGADGLLHPQEKLVVIKEKAALDRRVTEVRGRMVTLGLSVAALDAASAALNGYLAGLTPAWNSSAAPTPIVRGTWNATWQAVYDQAEIGAAAVSAEDARRAIWPNVTGTGRPADNATRNVVTYGATAPASPIDGDLWVNTSGTFAVFNLRVAGTWQVGANALSVYNALSGRPVALADINTTESSKLSGIEPLANRSTTSSALNRNPAFEVWESSTKALGWTTLIGTATQVITSAAAYGGRLASLARNTAIESEAIPVAPGERIWLHYRFLTDAFRPVGVPEWYVIACFSDDGGSYQVATGRVNLGPYLGTPVSPAAGWQEGFAEFIVPAGTRYVRATAIFDDGQTTGIQSGSLDRLEISRQQPGATVGAPAGTPIAGRAAESVVTQLDQKARSFHQAAPPENPQVGWIWTVPNENIQRRWNGTGWEVSVAFIANARTTFAVPMPAGSTFALLAAGTLGVGPGGTSSVSATMGYSPTTGAGRVDLAVFHRPVPGTGAWTQIGDIATGTEAATGPDIAPGEPGPLTLGSVGIFRTLPGPAGAANQEFAIFGRIIGSGLTGGGSAVVQFQP